MSCISSLEDSYFKSSFNIILLNQMSRYTHKTTINRSLGSASFRSKAETTVPTVFIAINKLKFEQDKLLE